MRFKSKSIFDPASEVGASNFGPSLTVPDQSMSIEEIIERFTRNENLPIAFEYTFDDGTDIDLEKLDRLDLVERDQLIAQLKDTQYRYEEQERQLLAFEEAKKQKELEDRIRAEMAAEAAKTADKSAD